MVERFTIYASPGNDDHWMGHHETGEYTRYSDYADLERQIAELRAERKLISDYIRPLVPSDQDPAQADSALGIIGYMVVTLARAEAAEADKARLSEALMGAAAAFRTYAASAEGPFATRYELAKDLRNQGELIDAALSGSGAGGWRTIESAPKDGTLILLSKAGDPNWPLRCRRWQDTHWRGRDAEDATHWMPLPAAPTATGGR